MSKKPKGFRRGRVGASIVKGDVWRFRWTDPDSGQEVSKRVSCETKKKAQEIADNLDRKILTGEGFLPGRTSNLPIVAMALDEAVERSNQREHSKRRSRTEGNRFLAWVDTAFPRVERFDQLKPSMIRAYAAHLEREGLARDSIRLALEPIRQAWRNVSEDHPREMLPWPKIKLPDRKPGGPDCLEPSEVRALLGWLWKADSLLWPIGTLAALAGLRQLEAAHLRRCDVDLERGTVTVTDTGLHEPKNGSSYRTIPVCAEVRWMLERWIDSLPAVPVGEALLFTTEKGCPWNLNRLSKVWKKNLDQAKAESEARKKNGKKELPSFWKLPPRKLRAFFGTMAGRLAVPQPVAQAYMGHTPSDIYGRHYRNLNPVELLSVSSVMDTWRTTPDFGEVWKQSGNIENRAVVNS
jgi:integrase